MANSGFDLLGNVATRFPEIEFGRAYDGSTKVYVKTNRIDFFSSEVAGLAAMNATSAIRVAEVIGCGYSESEGYALVLAAIKSSTPSDRFFEEFGRQLAQMHRLGAAERFGFELDNYLGATSQPNPWSENWVEFWSVNRIEHQLKLAMANGLGGSQLQSLGQRLLERLDALLGRSSERPSLIHGDLWSGNWLCDEKGAPSLIDPSAYYANREAEFGMTTLFGSLPDRFYDAYDEAFPLAEGWQDRVAIYRLYHVLNHLNLFGNSYLGSCLEILRRYV